MPTVTIHRSPDNVYRRCTARTRECEYEHLTVEGSPEEILRFFNTIRHTGEPYKAPAKKSTYTGYKGPISGVAKNFGPGAAQRPAGTTTQTKSTGSRRATSGAGAVLDALPSDRPFSTSNRTLVEKAITWTLGKQFKVDTKAADTQLITKGLADMAADKGIPIWQRYLNIRGSLQNVYGPEGATDADVTLAARRVLQRAGYIAAPLFSGKMRLYNIDRLEQHDTPASRVYVGDVVRLPESRATYIVTGVKTAQGKSRNQVEIALDALYMATPLVDSNEKTSVLFGNKMNVPVFSDPKLGK